MSASLALAQRPLTLWLGCFVLLGYCYCRAAPPAMAQTEADSAKRVAPAAEAAADEVQQLHAQFQKTMNNSTLAGHFTVDGRDLNQLKPERYEIRKVTKLDEGDFWLFNARIKYGDHDVTVPIPVEVKWAGKTPVITVDNLTIPGMGTFDARVVVSDRKYAGTWRHGEVGGLLFGSVESTAEKKEDVKDDKSEDPSDDPKSKEKE